MSKELIAAYRNFAIEVSHNFRYSLSPQSAEFLEKVLAKADSYTMEIAQDTKLFRARINRSKDGTEIDTLPYGPLDMKPIPNVVSEGRANAGNICALYLADSIGTALAEVRAGTQHPTTVATLTTNKSLKIVDLSISMNWFLYFNPHHKDGFWMELSHDFSKPLGSHNQHTHYAKTQIIAEHFKRNGFDGISYRSQFITHERNVTPEVNYGMNYALFDLADADCGESRVYHVTQQLIVYDEISNSVPK